MKISKKIQFKEIPEDYQNKVFYIEGPCGYIYLFLIKKCEEYKSYQVFDSKGYVSQEVIHINHKFFTNDGKELYRAKRALNSPKTKSILKKLGHI
jgi:hypothetical protein